MNLVVRRPSRRRLAVAVVVLLLAGVLASFVVASAAQLNFGSVARQHAEVKARCDLDGVALTTPPTGSTTTRVDVSGIAADCAGLPIVVRVSTGAGVSSSTTAVNVAANGGSMTINTASPAFSPAAVAQTSVTIGDWPMSGTWSYTAPSVAAACVVSAGVTHWSNNNPVVGPVQSGDSCAVPTITRTSTWGSGSALYEQWNVTVRNTGAREIVWQLNLDFSVAPFSGWTVRAINGMGPSDSWGGLAQTGCAQLPTMRVGGGNAPWNTTLTPGESLTFEFQIASTASASGFGIVCP